MKPRYLLALVLVTGLAVLGIWALIARKLETLPAGASTSPPAWRPECPGGDSLSIIVTDSVRETKGQVVHYTHTIHEIPLAGDNSNIPEFHDCQRFIVTDENGSPQYDSLYAIFASAQLGSLADSADTLPYTARKWAWPAAVILSYGGTYPSLGIKPDFNCLYLYREGSLWKAKLVHIGTDEMNCIAPLVDPVAATGEALNVSAPPVDLSYSRNDYPDVARWDWDSVHLKQYIGIKCGKAWCEDGASGFVPSFSYSESPPVEAVPGPAVTFNQRRRVFGIKGWYDRQQLAKWDESGKIAPGPVWGIISPHPVLDRSDHDVASYFRPWVHVATAVASADYDTKFVSYKRGKNKIWLCSGSAGECGVPDAVSACPTTTGLLWWAKMQPAVGGVTTYRCVIMRAHPNLNVLGTSRWRWSEEDETNWMRCTQGCCEIH